ncbi:MAG: cobalamin biosynthesis protein CbiD, partial [Oscillospiraceae bacterium]|nr:cobalamin biosynthesis protein CbiD [Oscillospiraceae bacterium]
MALEHYLRSGSRMLRCGITTGTCASLAASGAAQFLLTGISPSSISLVTPKGLTVEVEPVFCRMEGAQAVCAVRKDAGDDPDVTDGLLIVASVHKSHQGIRIDGGAGVGRVTKKGLDQPVGAVAINSIPRKMIAAAVESVCAEAGYAGGLDVVISVPEGEETARKTFNPMLGIEGGISILGTSGIVEPMSEQAIVDTIEIEIRQAAKTGAKNLIAVPGNYGLDFMKQQFRNSEGIPVVKCSNYLGDTIDIALTQGIESILIVGHIGKLVKLAGGIMNT